MKVSVCIATYNGATFIEKSLASILPQLSSMDELIIVDDASTDETVSMIQNRNDHRILVHQHKKNQGVSPSFYEALEHATGDLIFIADQDDIWNENKVEVCKNLFQKEQYELLVHNGDIYQNGQFTETTIFDLNKSGRGFLKNLWSDCYVGCCMVMTAQSKEKLLPKRRIKGLYYDHYLGLMAEWKRLNIHFEEQCLIQYQRHDTNHTDIHKRRNLVAILKDRGQLLWMLILNRWR